MTKPMISRGIRYNAPAGVIMDILQKMVDIANEENAFVYEWLNGTLTVVEPGMTAEQALQFVHAVRKEETKVEFCDVTYALSAGKKIEKLAKDNDMVLFSFGKDVFRVSKGATEKDIMEILPRHNINERFNYAANKIDELAEKRSAEQKQSIAQAMQQNQFDDR